MSCKRYILIVSDVKKSNENDNLTVVDLNMHEKKLSEPSHNVVLIEENIIYVYCVMWRSLCFFYS